MSKDLRRIAILFIFLNKFNNRKNGSEVFLHPRYAKSPAINYELFMSKKQSLEKLRDIIDELPTGQMQIFYKNSFALCCYLITQGQVKAARKQLNYLFDTLGWDHRKTYFSVILSSIEEYAVEYAGDIRANLEIN